MVIENGKADEREKTLYLSEYYKFYEKIHGKESVRIFKTPPRYTTNAKELRLIDKLDTNLKLSINTVNEIFKNELFSLVTMHTETGKLIAFGRLTLIVEDNKSYLVIPEIIIVGDQYLDLVAKNIYAEFITYVETLALNTDINYVSVEIPDFDELFFLAAFECGYEIDTNVEHTKEDKTSILVRQVKERDITRGRSFNS